MKKNRLAGILLLTIGVFPVFSTKAYATEATGVNSGHIGFTGDYEDVGIRDPENPEKVVDPGESPSTSGSLRIDFVPQFNFSINKASKKDAVYPVNAQLFHDKTAARGNYIQISDYRGASLGWTLQLKQETQFQNSQAANRQLDGAVLSLDKSWSNSTEEQQFAPVVSKEVIAIDNIGSSYNLAEAKVGTGQGTWTISFGASKENPFGLANTLTPKQNEKNVPIVDSTFENQQVQENSAITLSIPGATKKDPVAYTTVLTWVLAELP